MGITAQLALTYYKSNRLYKTESLELQSNTAMDSFIKRSKTMFFGFMAVAKLSLRLLTGKLPGS